MGLVVIDRVAPEEDAADACLRRAPAFIGLEARLLEDVRLETVSVVQRRDGRQAGVDEVRRAPEDGRRRVARDEHELEVFVFGVVDDADEVSALRHLLAAQ